MILTPKQKAALKIITETPKNDYLYLLMYGGSQSAKTSFACYYIQMASLLYPHTTSIICRNSFVNLKATITHNTFPKILSLKLGVESVPPGIVQYSLSPPMCANFYNGSKVYFIGLEDNLNFEKILGRQCSMFLIDEASEVGYRAFSKLTTRMTQNSGARKVGFVTMNPTSVFHWAHKLFLEKKNPLDDKPVKNPNVFRCIQMNPKDNLDNLPEGYVENLDNLSEAERERFLYGNFTLTTENAVYEKELKFAKEQNQITELPPPDYNYPMYFSLDLGWDDFSASWIFQVLPKGILFYAYLETQNENIINFITQIRRKIADLQSNRKYKTDIIGILPHDAMQHSVQTGLNIKQLLSMYEGQADQKDVPVISYKQLKLKGKFDGINVAKVFFPKAKFDAVQCDVGIRRLGLYKQIIIDGNDKFRQETIHDASSHAADAFRYAMVSIHDTRNPYLDSHDGVGNKNL
jgi:PBSX family phage terminase large subunit